MTGSQTILSALLLINLLQTILTISSQENGKFLNIQNTKSETEERKLFGHKNRRPQLQGPCNFGAFGNKKSAEGTGKTFFDLQLYNVGYTNNYNYHLNCGGTGGGGGGSLPPLGNKPLLEGGLPPLLNHHKPSGGNGGGGLLASHFQNSGGHFASHFPGGGGQGLFANRPVLSGIFGTRPLQGLFGQTQSQSQSQSQSGILSDFLYDLLPTPNEIGQGFSAGIQSFIGTIPQIGQSIQSVLPTFSNFQLPSLSPQPGQGPALQFPAPPQGGPVFSNPFNRPSGPAPPPVVPATPVPPISGGPTPTTDPDDVIFNDGIKPVHEDHDPILDPFSQRVPPGYYNNRRRVQYPQYYRGSNAILEHRSNSGQKEYNTRPSPRDQQPQPRSFTFPT